MSSSHTVTGAGPTPSLAQRGGFFGEGSDESIADALAGEASLYASGEMRRKRARQALPPERRLVHDPPLELPLEDNPTCEKCSLYELDSDYHRWFGVHVCAACRKTDEMYRLVTKTEAKEDFLVTDSEIDKLRFISRPNPHNSNWKDMKLYLYKQVYDYAIKKWGSEDKLNEAFLAKEDRRTSKRGKSKLFSTHISDLRAQARTTERLNKLLTQHEHVFKAETLQDAAASLWSKTCATCGYKQVFEKL